MKRERRMNPKCLGRPFPDTFSARSAHLTGLKMSRITRAASFDHLVGDGEHAGRNGEAERLGRLHVNDQLEFGRLLDRQITGLFAFKNAAGMDPDQVESVRKIRSVAHETASLDELASPIQRR